MVWYGMVWYGMYLCMYVCVYIYAYVCICMYTYIRLSLYIYVHIHTYIYIYIHIYNIYIHIHMYCTHIYTSWNSFRKCFATPGRPPQWELTCHEKLEEDLQKLGRQPRKSWWMMVSCDWSWLVMGYFMDFHGFSWIFHGFSGIFMGYLMILCLMSGGFWSHGSPSHLGFNAKSPKVIRMTTGWELGVTPMTLETSLTDL